MSVKEPPANAKLPLDQDRLITAIQGCFRDLVKRQEEQFKSQEAQAERLQETIEALKPQGPVTDKKTTFWNSYMKLADEYDKEFQQKYITDLDSALIFAGLFSAVSSAFITEIQPQIIPPSQPKTLIVVSQTLLYISLFTTLLAALLAVLGKQWVMYYQSAGSRGTIEQRGLERQRKLAGLRRWKFDVVLQMFPLLLQLALLLFSTALSVYLWTIHRSIAVIVLVITFLGFGSYIFLLVSPIISADSPFQTPLAPFLIQLIASVLRILKFAALNVHTFGTQGWASVSGLVKSRTHILPRVVSDTSSSKSSYRTRKSLHGHHESRFFPPSLEGPAVLWVLETSTDPAMISVAAEMAIDLQWPLDLDLTVAMGRLEETFKSCFDIPSRRIRDGTTHRAIKCGRAYCSLRLIDQADNQNKPNPTFRPNTPIQNESDDPVQFAQLLNVVRIMNGWPDLVHAPDAPLALPWGLHVIPSLKLENRLGILEHFLDQFPAEKIPEINASTFTAYLCCVHSFLAPIKPAIIAQMDKSLLQDFMILQLFEVFRTYSQRNPVVIAKALNITAQLAIKLQAKNSRMMENLMKEIPRFCRDYNHVYKSDVLASAEDP